MVSQSLVGSPVAKIIKDHFGLDDLEFDGSTRMFTQLEADVKEVSEITYGGLFVKPHTEKREREFFHVMCKWRKGKDAWNALLPVEVMKTKVNVSGIRAYFENGYVCHGFDWVLDDQKMVDSLYKLIEESLNGKGL